MSEEQVIQASNQVVEQEGAEQVPPSAPIAGPLTPEQEARKHEEQLTGIYNVYVPRFLEMVDKLSTKSLRRVLKNTVLLPLRQDIAVNLNAPEEEAITKLIEYHMKPISTVFIQKVMLEWQRHEMEEQKKLEAEQAAKETNNQEEVKTSSL